MSRHSKVASEGVAVAAEVVVVVALEGCVRASAILVTEVAPRVDEVLSLSERAPCECLVVLSCSQVSRFVIEMEVLMACEYL